MAMSKKFFCLFFLVFGFYTVAHAMAFPQLGEVATEQDPDQPELDPELDKFLRTLARSGEPDGAGFTGGFLALPDTEFDALGREIAGFERPMDCVPAPAPAPATEPAPAAASAAALVETPPAFCVGKPAGSSEKPKQARLKRPRRSALEKELASLLQDVTPGSEAPAKKPRVLPVAEAAALALTSGVSMDVPGAAAEVPVPSAKEVVAAALRDEPVSVQTAYALPEAAFESRFGVSRAKVDEIAAYFARRKKACHKILWTQARSEREFILITLEYKKLEVNLQDLAGRYGLFKSGWSLEGCENFTAALARAMRRVTAQLQKVTNAAGEPDRLGRSYAHFFGFTGPSMFAGRLSAASAATDADPSSDSSFGISDESSSDEGCDEPGPAIRRKKTAAALTSLQTGDTDSLAARVGQWVQRIMVPPAAAGKRLVRALKQSETHQIAHLRGAIVPARSSDWYLAHEQEGVFSGLTGGVDRSEFNRMVDVVRQDALFKKMPLDRITNFVLATVLARYCGYTYKELGKKGLNFYGFAAIGNNVRAITPILRLGGFFAHDVELTHEQALEGEIWDINELVRLKDNSPELFVQQVGVSPECFNEWETVLDHNVTSDVNWRGYVITRSRTPIRTCLMLVLKYLHNGHCTMEDIAVRMRELGASGERFNRDNVKIIIHIALPILDAHLKIAAAAKPAAVIPARAPAPAAARAPEHYFAGLMASDDTCLAATGVCPATVRNIVALAEEYGVCPGLELPLTREVAILAILENKHAHTKWPRFAERLLPVGATPQKINSLRAVLYNAADRLRTGLLIKARSSGKKEKIDLAQLLA